MILDRIFVHGCEDDSLVLVKPIDDQIETLHRVDLICHAPDQIILPLLEELRTIAKHPLCQGRNLIVKGQVLKIEKCCPVLQGLLTEESEINVTFSNKDFIGHDLNLFVRLLQV